MEVDTRDINLRERGRDYKTKNWNLFPAGEMELVSMSRKVQKWLMRAYWETFFRIFYGLSSIRLFLIKESICYRIYLLK